MCVCLLESAFYCCIIPSILNIVKHRSHVCIKVIHNVRPWPVSSQPYGLTSAFPELGVSMVVKDPSVWEDDRIVLIGGSRAVFKFVHNEGPILSSLHMYDHMVSLHLSNFSFVWFYYN